MPLPPTPPFTGFPWIRVTQSAVTSVSSSAGTGTKLVLDTAVDSGNGWPKTNPASDITIPFSGIVLIIAHDCDFGDSSSGVGHRALNTRRNDVVGSAKRGDSKAAVPAGSAKPTVCGFSACQAYNAGDTLQFYAFQDSGGSLNVALNDVTLFLMTFGAPPGITNW